MKHPEQQQVQLTAQAQTAYSGMRETSMAEPQAEQPKPNRFRRVIHKLRRRKPQPVQRVNETEEEERRREREAAETAADVERELQRQRAEAAREIAHVESESVGRREEPRVTMREGGGTTTLLRTEEALPELPVDGITSPRLRELVGLYNLKRQHAISETAEGIEKAWKEISDAIVDPNTGASAAEIAFVRSEVLSLLQETIMSQRRRDQEKEQEYLIERREAEARQNERYDYLNRRVRNAEGKEARRDHIIAERETRDRAFEAIFAKADSQSNVRFDQAFDIFTDGAKYNTFLNDLLMASEDVRDITPEAVEAYKRISKKPDASDAEIRKTIQLELREDIIRYQLERQVRETLHNANFVLELPNIKAEDIYGFTDTFSSVLVDHVWKTPGVRDMMNIYEDQLRFAMFENDGYLRPADVQRYTQTAIEEVGGEMKHRKQISIPAVEERTKLLFRQYMDKNAVYVRSDSDDSKDNGKMYIKKGADFTDAEIERLFMAARGMLVLSQRMLSLAAESKIPSNARYTSLYMQDALQGYNPYAHLLGKYGVPNWKALGMFLAKEDREKVLGVRKPWAVKDLEHIKHIAEEPGGLRAIMDGEYGEDLRLRMQNPGFCGDVFGYVGWRVGQNPTDVSGSQRFLVRGVKTMDGLIGGENSEPKNIVQKLTEKINNPETSQEDREKYKKMLTNYRNEYSNWIGTGLRLESQRREILMPSSPKDEASAILASKTILSSVARLQPGRMFLKSYKMQKRLKGKVDAWYRSAPVNHNDPKMTSGEVLLQVQNNLLYLESKMYQMRDVLLREGYTFDGVENKRDAKGEPIPELADVIGKEITLELIAQRLGTGEKVPHPELLDSTFKFRDIVLNDFKENKDATGHWEDPSAHHDAHGDDAHGGHHGKTFRAELEGQYQEFIFNRDYNHGYTVWSGDSPVDEFSMVDTGPTGAFIRRARENKDVGEANGLIVGFLSDLKYNLTPDQAFGHLTEIYSKIQSYDADMAKQTVVYLTEGLLKFYGSTGVANAPILGMIVMNYPGLIPFLYKLPYKVPKFAATLVPKVVLKGMRILGANDAVDSWDEKIANAKSKLGGIPGVDSAKGFDAYFTGSFAQRVFEGKRAAVWKAYEKHYLVQHLLSEHGYIKPEQAKYLKSISSGRGIDVGANFVSFFGPFIAMAIILYLIKEGAEEV